MIKFELESAVSAAYEFASRKQYREAVKAVAGSIVEMYDTPYLYDANDVENYKHGAVFGLLWMVDGLAACQIERDINIAVDNLEAAIIDEEVED